VFAVEPRGLRRAQEELTAVRVGTGVCHTENSGADVCQLEVLVRELIAVDGLTAGAVVASEVTALTHESRYDSVERTAFECELRVLLAGAQCAEVFGGLWYGISAEFHGDTTGIGAADGDIKEDFRVGLVSYRMIAGHDDS